MYVLMTYVAFCDVRIKPKKVEPKYNLSEAVCPYTYIAANTPAI